MNNQRFGTLFNTSKDSWYYYDSGTGKVISCSQNEKDIVKSFLDNQLSLEELNKSNKEIAEFIKQENLFACPEKRSFLVPTKSEFRKLVEGECEQIILELTESCNLRCGYCIYHEHHPDFRGFTNKKMEFDVAKKSIDYVLGNCTKDTFALTFYGGEPLINFEVMKNSINYALEMYSNFEFHISFTTNLTLLTEKMVDYFSSLNVEIDIMCSIDGPIDVHDKYRRYADGKGSFNDTIKGFKLLVDKFYDPNNKKTISINSVLAPPYSKENMDKVNAFFYEELKIDDGIKCNYTYMDKGDMVFDFEANGLISDGIPGKLVISPLEEWAVDNLMKSNNEQYFDVVSVEMARVTNRMRVKDGVIEATYLHGNCIPGQRRIYVTVDGEFKACEKVGESPTLGNYEKGFDCESAYKYYITDYIAYFEKLCNNCWANPMCTICYERTMNDKGVKKGVEDTVCVSSRHIVKDILINYYRLWEKDKDELERLLSRYEYK